jgi:hypothetical protein
MSDYYVKSNTEAVITRVSGSHHFGWKSAFSLELPRLILVNSRAVRYARIPYAQAVCMSDLTALRGILPVYPEVSP